MAPISTMPIMERAIDYAEQKSGKKIIRIDTPGVNVEDTPEGRRDAEALIKHSAEIGSDFCLLHHTCVEKLLDKGSESIPRLPDYLSMIRDAGMIPGLSTHMPETVVYADSCGYDVETYIQIFNCMGFLMQVEVENVARIIHDAKKPVGISIKSDIYSQEQHDFIEGFVNNVFRIMYEAAYHDRAFVFDDAYGSIHETDTITPRQAVESVVDVQSLVDMYIISELTCDADIYWSSFFMDARRGYLLVQFLYGCGFRSRRKQKAAL